MKNFNKRMAAREGFTLVELIVVIAILAILAAVSYPAYTGYIKKADETADITNLAGVYTAASAAMAADGSFSGLTSIVVSSDGKTVTVNGTVLFGTTSGGTKEATQAQQDTFKLLYFGDTSSTADTVVEFKSDTYSTSGATWTKENNKWAPTTA